MFQKAYKKDTDTALLSAYILNCKHSKEFFIQKAIGWALREYSKTNPGWVKKFVEQNQLAPLSKREALKRMQFSIDNWKLKIENESECENMQACEWLKIIIIVFNLNVKQIINHPYTLYLTPDTWYL